MCVCVIYLGVFIINRETPVFLDNADSHRQHCVVDLFHWFTQYQTVSLDIGTTTTTWLQVLVPEMRRTAVFRQRFYVYIGNFV